MRLAWASTRAWRRAAGTYAALSTRVSPRERWRRAYRIQRKIQHEMMRRLLRCTIGTLYGVTVYRSRVG